ncbi:hypothetical protein [Fodinibius halophilus]|uniref:Uncharacterized protein n=1 Tax=Fodinibius halophilus TaxID=1736908 RepID=A0A6M1T0G2_9BACT|nr:hypothetical protein [Fodinibius halophilus]NGP89588.1 hypothetical protein [Fodinibius halophilus]
MTQIGCLLRLRVKMVSRLFTELGWLRSVLLLVLMGIGVGQLTYVRDPAGLWALVVTACSIIAGIHSRRSDIGFLYSISPKPYLVVTIEYFVAFLPLLIFLLYNQFMPGVAVVLAFAAGWPLIFRRRGDSHIINSEAFSTSFLIPSFEWIGGLRNMWWLVLIVLAGGIILTYLNFVAGLVTLFCITAIITGFYAENESIRFITLIADHSTSFLIKKITRELALYSIISLPIWGSCIMLYPDRYLYTLLFLLLNTILLAMVLLAKYTLYQPKRSIELPIATYFIVLSFFLFVPYLQIGVPFIAIFLWIKAKRRLNKKVYARA